jgi:hypothetical protein
LHSGGLRLDFFRHNGCDIVAAGVLLTAFVKSLVAAKSEKKGI